jgi:hypothetical protein
MAKQVPTSRLARGTKLGAVAEGAAMKLGQMRIHHDWLAEHPPVPPKAAVAGHDQALIRSR